MPPHEPSGLLSKVVKFVRNPTTHWSELDQPELDKESEYSKQMLKEMVERKRRNDFVRRREFDQLRKLRQREVLALPDTIERPSFFQSSLQSKQDDRASTLKKIDEIEAQMSQQWWKAKDAGHSKPLPLAKRSGLNATELPGQEGANAYAATLPSSLSMAVNTVRGNAFPATDVAPLWNGRGDFAQPSSEPMVDMLAALDERINFGLLQPAPLLLPELDLDDIAKNPGLEEAAIRFANGDALGAEGTLLALLHTDPAPDSWSEIWLALFDLYRATGQQESFDTIGIDFATRFGRSGPAWFSIPDQAGQSAMPEMLAESTGQAGTPFSWACPGVLDAAALAGLQSALKQRKPSMVAIGWDNLRIIDSAAVDGLAALFSEWTRQAVQLQFADVSRLEELLKSRALTGDAGVHQAWWRLRLDLLRAQHCPDAFDMVALEYCITYEVSPPAWEEALCTYAALDPDGGTALPQASAAVGSGFKDTAVGMGGSPRSTFPPSLSVLAGAVLGDASAALAEVDAPAETDGVLHVSCDHLLRIDFSAAGSVLNWASDQQAAGRQVQFTGLHRLAAIFFNVVGINEYAKVIPRRN